MTKTVSILITATLGGEDAPTVAEQEALLLRYIHNSSALLTEKYGIGLTYDVGAASAPHLVEGKAPVGASNGKPRGPRLTPEVVQQIANSPDGWAKAAASAGYTSAGIRGAAERFGIELPGVRKRANGADHNAA